MVYAVVGNPIVNNVGQLLSAILARKVYAEPLSTTFTSIVTSRPFSIMSSK